MELVELARAPVGAGVLVAKAGGDMEILVEARHHDQRLEHLRRLRERVEFTGVDAARHQIVARTFRRRGGKARRLDHAETMIDRTAEERADKLAAAGVMALKAIEAVRAEQ